MRRGLALAVLAKAPLAGRVKTRLSPALPPAEAAELQEALLRDTLSVARAVARRARPPAHLVCAAAEPADETSLRRFLPPGVAFVAQGGGDLGARLARVLGTLLERHAGALAIGADCPDLTPDRLGDALAALVTRGAVLGPAADGGYWAIGIAEPRPELFRAIPWSTNGVAAATRERLAQLGLEAAELPVLRDLDHYEDLVAWAHRPNRRFRHTLAWCRDRGLA